MKRLCVIAHEKDYFARDALMGEIQHHRDDVAFSGAELAGGVVLIAGANLMKLGHIEEILAQNAHKGKPLLVVVSHKENEEAVKIAAPNLRCIGWEWTAINNFIEEL